MNIKGQVAIVTGGASGLGEACVQMLQSEGAKVAIWDRISPNSNALFIACDVSSAESCEAALQQTIETLGCPRIGIQCAGIAPAKRMFGRAGLMSLDDFQQVIDINLVGTFNVMRLLSQCMSTLSMEGEERGVIINTSSIAAVEGQIGQMAYSASKGGVNAMTLPAARELAQFAIRINTIAPGLMATPLLLNMPPEVQDSLASTVTFPPRFGKPQEFASLSKEIIKNPFINGEIIRLDGGLRMQAR